MRRLMLGVVWPLTLLFVPLAASPLSAASTFADSQFRTQWQAGEAAAPNFWGPLENARDGTMEQYAGPGSRLVQYFDKARMELTGGSVTAGLLTVELKSGKRQVGDTAYEQNSPAQAVLAGDPGSSGPTYADLAKLPEHRDITAQTPAVYKFNDDRTFTLLSIDEEKKYVPAFGSDLYALEDPSGRYGQLVYGPFQAFIKRLIGAGIPVAQTPGYAISPIIVADVPIGGRVGTIFIQAFERRVLTYDPGNPAEFRVEFGNIGRHYYQWRYGTPSATLPPPPPPPVPPSPPAPPAATALTVTFGSLSSPIAAGKTATASIQTAPNANCSIVVSYKSGPSTAQGLVPKTANVNGLASWSWTVGTNTTPGSWPVDVTCTANGQTATQRAMLVVT